MSESILLEGTEYVSAKRAADETGYARDYIGQLARKGLIRAQRVGGLWYVALDSLKGYQAHAEQYAPQPPAQQGSDADAIVSFDGRDYVSASRAAKLSGYTQDYVGQLARGGKILSRQVGNRWYVDKEGLLSHKAQKDSMLASVQREALGLSPQIGLAPKAPQEPYTPFYSYTAEKDKDLLPAMPKVSRASEPPIRRVSPIQMSSAAVTKGNVIDMRSRTAVTPLKRVERSSGKTMRRAIKVGSALTFVIVLSYGLSSLKSSSHYTLDDTRLGSMLEQTASAIGSADAIERFTSAIERLVTKELVYKRVD